MATPGLKFLCRDSVSLPRIRVRPSVLGPLRRAGCVRHLRQCRNPERPCVHRRQPRCLQRRDAVELVAQHHAADDDPRADEARHSRGGSPREWLRQSTPRCREAQQMLGEIWTYRRIRARRDPCSREQARNRPGGVWFPDAPPLHALRATLPCWFPRVNEIIRLNWARTICSPRQPQRSMPTLHCDRCWKLPARR